MRHSLQSVTALAAAGVLAAALSQPAHAQKPPVASAKPPASATAQPPTSQPPTTQSPNGQSPDGQSQAGQPQAAANPVVATVNGAPIHLSDVSDAAQALPEQMHGLQPSVLFPIVLDQLIDRQAVVAEAKREKLDQNPLVAREIVRAEDTALQNALIRQDVAPQITEAAIRARYDKEIAGKPGEEEVDAAHILVPSEADAQKLITQLKAGADFATLAKQNSTDPAGAQGGDLGFFKKGDMLPEFADAAFKLQPGQFTETPVKTRYGWHVIKVLARRQAPPPSFAEAHDQLRQEMIQEAVRAVVEKARAGVTVVRFNPDGSPLRATDQAEPPPAPAPATGK